MGNESLQNVNENEYLASNYQNSETSGLDATEANAEDESPPAALTPVERDASEQSIVDNVEEELMLSVIIPGEVNDTLECFDNTPEELNNQLLEEIKKLDL